jgi:epidermal growth factor receptor
MRRCLRFQGCWIPSNTGEKIYVAIKVLSEGTSPSQNKELLEEARIMASVVHPCCVRLRAVCMTAQTMLISELMPLGCLLDFVRKYENRLTSAILINWSKQIAQVCEQIAALIYTVNSQFSCMLKKIGYFGDFL